VIADATLRAYFLGVDIERLKTQGAFFAMALGGPNTYTEPDSSRRSHQDVARAANDEVFEWLAVFEGARGQILDR
jgi:truncated hemoglobin YjbI